MIKIDQYNLTSNTDKQRVLKSAKLNDEPHWVQQLIKAISTNNKTEIESISQRHSRWLNKPLPSHKGQSMCDAIRSQNQNILHLVFRYCPSEHVWSCLHLFDTVFNVDEDFMCLMFQEDKNGFTPIHYAFIFAKFEDVWFIVHSVLNSSLHMWNEWSAEETEKRNSMQAQDNILFDNEMYSLLLKPFRSIQMNDELMRDENRFSAFVQCQLNRKLNLSCEDDLYLPMTQLLVQHFGFCDVNASVVEDSKTPLFTAVVRRQTRTIDYLVSQCSANVNSIDPTNDYSVLTYCIVQGEDMDQLRYFVAHGADVNLGHCVEKSVELLRRDVLKFLLDNKATPPDDILYHVFAHDASNNQLQEEVPQKRRSEQHSVIETLLDSFQGSIEEKARMINYSEKDKCDTMIVECTRRGMDKTVDLLLENGADLSASSQDLQKKLIQQWEITSQKKPKRAKIPI